MNHVRKEVVVPEKNQTTSLSSGVEDEDIVVGDLENVAPIIFFTPNELTALLKQTDIGKRLLENSNNILSTDSKKELASIIAAYHLNSSWSHPDSNKRKLSKFMLENYVHCIKLRFPKESADTVGNFNILCIKLINIWTIFKRSILPVVYLLYLGRNFNRLFWYTNDFLIINLKYVISIRHIFCWFTSYATMQGH